MLFNGWNISWTSSSSSSCSLSNFSSRPHDVLNVIVLCGCRVPRDNSVQLFRHQLNFFTCLARSPISHHCLRSVHAALFSLEITNSLNSYTALFFRRINRSCPQITLLIRVSDKTVTISGQGNERKKTRDSQQDRWTRERTLHHLCNNRAGRLLKKKVTTIARRRDEKKIF